MRKALPGRRLKPSPLHNSGPAQAIPEPDGQPVQGSGQADFQETTVAAMFGLGDWEMRAIDLRIRLARAIREIRLAAGMTQGELARRLETSQPKIARLESPAHEPTLDSLVPAFFAAGGTVAQLCKLIHQTDEAVGR